MSALYIRPSNLHTPILSHTNLKLAISYLEDPQAVKCNEKSQFFGQNKENIVNNLHQTL